MGLAELFLAILLTGLSAVNLVVPSLAWHRTRDPRFFLVVGANLCLLALGAVWTWGQLPVAPPAFTGVSLPVVTLGAAASLFLLGVGLLPRRD